jgi:hypothetical protein
MILCARDDIATPYEAMRLCRVMTFHFNESNKYDALRYNFGGMHLKEETYRNHPQRMLYEKISKKYGRVRDVIGYYVANIVDGQTWCCAMSDAVEAAWRGRVQAANYSFRSAIWAARESVDRFDDLMSDEILFSEEIEHIFNHEHRCILHALTGFANHINKNDPLGIYASKKYLIKSYTPLIQTYLDKNSAIREIKSHYSH